MDKIARVRQEIERRLNILTNVYAEQVERKDEEMMNYYHGKVIALEELRPFLDTLSEEPDKSLEEEYKDYVENDPVYSKLVNGIVGLGIARHFAQWQKEQMLKNAFVDNYVVNDGRIELEGDPLPSLDPILILPYSQFKPGDKVRIVVLGAEEE